MRAEHIYFFEHAPTGTFGRTVGDSIFQIIRGDQLLQEVRFVGAPSGDEHGNVLLGSSNVVVNLAGEFPVPVPITVFQQHEVLHPRDGRVAFGVAGAQLVHRPVEGDRQSWWAGPDVLDATRIWPFSGAKPEQVALVRGKDWHPGAFQIRVWADETWVLFDRRTAVFGQRNILHGCVTNAELELRHVTYDPARERLLFSSESGMFALGRTGDVQASWQSGSDQLKSPAHFYGDDLLAVVETEHRQRVMRFNPVSLQPGRRFRRLPWLETRDFSALATLADGSLVWVPERAPIILSPATGVIRHSTEWVRVEPKPPRAIPRPEAHWYDPTIGATGALTHPASSTPGRRRSLARWLLETLDDPTRFEALLSVDDEAFTPYADDVLEWDDTRLTDLRDLSPCLFYSVARGASDSAVDRLARRFMASPEDIQRLLAELLTGIDSDHALEVAANLSREYDVVKDACWTRALDVPGTGPAIRRFTRVRYDVVSSPGAPEPPLTAFEPSETFLIGARRPKVHLLGVPSSILMPSSRLLMHDFFTDLADDGWEVTDPYVFEATEGRRIRFHSGGPEGGPGRSLDEPPPPRRLTLMSPDRERAATLIGSIGGRPRWDSTNYVPCCPGCDQLMFYVGCIRADALVPQAQHYDLFGFQCEHCGIGAQMALKA